MKSKNFIPFQLLLFIISIGTSSIGFTQICDNNGDTGGDFGGPDDKDDPFCAICPPDSVCPPGNKTASDQIGTFFCILIWAALDPNDIVGPTGVGPEKWVARNATLKYMIRFENDPEFATAPAQNVLVDHIFSDKLNRNSFALGMFGFGNYAFEIPGNRSYYSSRKDVSEDLGVLLDFTTGINPSKNMAFWRLISLDPETALDPNPALGFLPVNDSTGIGEGFLEFTMQPKETTQTRDTIFAQASIVFDINDPILTNKYFNIIDADHPVSVLKINQIQNDTLVHLNIKSSDIGSGFESAEIYQSINSGPMRLLDTVFSEDTIRFYPVNERDTVCYLSFATDKVGNFEGWQKVYRVCTKDVMDSNEEEEETALNELLEAFPNPTVDQLTVRAKKGTPQGTLKLLSPNGTVLQTHTIGKGASVLNLNLAGYSRGIYFLQFISKDERYVLRVVKQ